MYTAVYTAVYPLAFIARVYGPFTARVYTAVNKVHTTRRGSCIRPVYVFGIWTPVTQRKHILGEGAH